MEVAPSRAHNSANTAGNQAFTPVDAFSGAAGELVIADLGEGLQRLAADVDGDGLADMEIDVFSDIALASTDIGL